MVGIKPKLLRSTIVLFLFYTSIALLVWLSMAPDTFTAWLESVGKKPDFRLDPINMLSFQIDFIYARIKEVAPWLIGGAVVAFALAAGLFALVKNKIREMGEGGTDSFRGVSVTISTVPKPKLIKVKPASMALPDGYPDTHAAVIKEIFGYLSKHKKSFVGEGHKGSIIDHTLNVMEAALDSECKDPLLLIAAAAHDIGKTVSHVKGKKGEWIKIGLHDKEGAKILTMMPSWWELNDVDRSILAHAVRYEHSISKMPYKIPGLSDDDMVRLYELVDALHEVDGNATALEKKTILSEANIEKEVFDAFILAIQNIPFQHSGINKGVKAAGWFYGGQMYLIEHRLRDFVAKHLSDDLKGALNVDYRDKGKLSAISLELVKSLKKAGLLVTEANVKERADSEPKMAKVDDDFPLWQIACGTQTFNAIYIIKPPKEVKNLPPASQYLVEVRGALKKPRGTVSDRDAIKKQKATNKETAQAKLALNQSEKPDAHEAAPENLPGNLPSVLPVNLPENGQENGKENGKTEIAAAMDGKPETRASTEIYQDGSKVKETPKERKKPKPREGVIDQEKTPVFDRNLPGKSGGETEYDDDDALF